MAQNYTYAQFEQAAKNAGLYNQFSDADIKLAQRVPDAGMSLLQYKKDYLNATTDEARALANTGAESVRSAYGNYSGGNDGSGYYIKPISPATYTPSAAPTYENRYDAQIQQQLGNLINRKDFSYSADNDPLYAQYKKAYTREGNRATQEALGAAAAATGGIPSSYAASAASQAGNYYAAQMADKIPELEQVAYDRYLNDYQLAMSDLNAVQSAEQNDYAKYLAKLDQYNADRNFEYGQHLDEISDQATERQELIDRAQLAANYGDYSRLNDMGINTDNNPTDWERQYELAQMAASVGDFSRLRAMGIDTSAAEAAYNATGDETADDTDAYTGETSGVLSSSDVAAIKSVYPDGAVTDDGYWNMLKNVYGENALTAAGLRLSTGADEAEVGGTTLGQNAVEVEKTLAAMKNRGASYDELMKAVKDAKGTGLITSKEYNLLTKKISTLGKETLG